GYLKRNSCVNVEGVMTHLSQADSPDPAFTLAQIRSFEGILSKLKEQGLVAGSHFMNSAALIDRFENPGAFARPGIMLYGAYPHARQRESISLRPVMILKTRLMGIRRMKAGKPISYGGTFITRRDSLIGMLPVGYADGYPRL